MRYLISIIFGVFSALVIFAAVINEDTVLASSFQQAHRLQVIDRLSAVRADLEAELNARLYLVHGLAAFAKTSPMFSEEDFQTFAKDLTEGFVGIRSLQLAPNAVVNHIYPLKGNEAAMGFDLLADPIQREAAQRAIAERQFIIAGPVELIQGGVALIGRHPIFLPVMGGAPGEERFWGFSTILIDLEPLLVAGGIIGGSDETRYALRGTDGLGASGAIFYGNQAVFEADPVMLDVVLPNGTWQLAGVPKDGWTKAWPGQKWLWGGGGSLAIIVGFLVNFLLLRTRELKDEIAERKLAEEALTRANHVLKAMSECSEALIHSKTEQELLSEICRLVVETGGYRMAWVGYSEHDAEKSVRPVASYGIDNGYVEGVRATWADTERGRGPVGTAARTGKPCVVQNYFNDPRFATWREAATKRGFASTASFPLLDQGRPFGSINFYAGDPDAFDEDEAHLLADLTSNLSYGILALRQAEARKQTAEELLRTKQEAEKANQAKSEFLASMSHELRTPLNAVLGFAQMLQFDPKTSLTPAQNEHVENILAGGNHLLELVNEVLDLARIEANKLDLSLEEISANDVVEECVALSAPLGESRDITIIDHFSGGSLSLLRSDRLRFKQSLINLLSNAVKYNRDGGTVTVEGRETEDGFLRISVTDTGIGIAANDYSNVFHMFHRLGMDPMVAQEGTGIGLTVTKLLVEQMAGQVGFESEEGVGSTFWIKLPLVSNEDVLIWTNTMRVGIDAIDKDHQVIISLLNRVTHGGIDDGGVDEVINELIEYAHYHFRREEAIMEVCGDPNLEKHRDYHQSLAAQLNELANNWHKDRDPVYLHRLREFLRDWVFNHVITVDTGISQYARGKDQDIREALENLE